MAKTGGKTGASKTTVGILIAQPKPESEKSPYNEIAKKHGVEIIFHPFILLEGIPARDFRKQKIDVSAFSAVILTSRNAIDHFFRMCEEMKIVISQDTKYFCVTENVALYLQKFIQYRKRKVFYGADGTNKSLFDVISRHKENEKFLYVCSENQQDNEIVSFLKANNAQYELAFMYRTISNDIKEVFQHNKIDVVCLFTPSAVKSLFDNFPKFKQNGMVIGAFGNNTAKAVEDAKLELGIRAPLPGTPSMITALDNYLTISSR